MLYHKTLSCVSRGMITETNIPNTVSLVLSVGYECMECKCLVVQELRRTGVG